VIPDCAIFCHPHPFAPLKFQNAHLAYCTNIHPAESWGDTQQALHRHVLKVRDLLCEQEILEKTAPFAIGLRLSARAAEELLQEGRLDAFRHWLDETNTYVFTINGFPYGNFHGTRVKENVFQPDWTEPARIKYTQNLFRILAHIAPPGTSASVSTLPGSHKTFCADEDAIRKHLCDFAQWLEALSNEFGIDLHLGLEPEPIGHIENTAETLAFFDRLQNDSKHPDTLRQRIGLNYDTCHFAIEFDDARFALDAIHSAGIRLSKIHLSSALALDPQDASALDAIRAFDEPTYFHQVVGRYPDGSLHRFIDLPYFLDAPPSDLAEARIHFHIPLDAEPTTPLRSTRRDVIDTLAWCRAHPGACQHFEIETYTWGVLPQNLQRPVEEQIAGEYRWVIGQA